MDYTFKIIDTQREDLSTKVEKALESSIILEWMGGDKKDELLIVGSRLSFTMVGLSLEDGQYLDLFTGDETRYRLVMEDANGTIIWQGFLLPDSYSEPYSNVPILVDFVATDGLGRLKGKYLPEDFYKEEKSVVEIISTCLGLTGLGLNFRFAPAIENSVQKDYNQIYIDTALFKNKEKREDAYKILNDLLESMCCTLYQADNYYNIEGFNIRNLRVYKTKEYTPDGTLLGEVEVTRLRKFITGVATPVIDMQPPYGVINISHAQEPLSLPEGLTTEENDGWSVSGKVQKKGWKAEEEEVGIPQIYATEWWGNNGFYAYASPEDNAPVYFGASNDPTKFIDLRRKPYVEKGKKYELRLNFEIIPSSELTADEIQGYINEGRWKNPFDFMVYMNSDEVGFAELFEDKWVIFSNMVEGNKRVDLTFDEDKKNENILHFTPNYSGLLNIQIRGVNLWDIGYERQIESIKIEKAELIDLGQKEEIVSEKTLNADYTTKKELDLVFGDDPTGLSKSFRLQKIKEPFESGLIIVPTGRKFQFQGSNYVEVDLRGANLIKENFQEDPELKAIVEDVIYNYNQGDKHVVKTKQPHEETFFRVLVRNYNKVTEVRDYWKQWTDSVYRVEKKRYPEIVANIHNRLFDKPVFRILDIEALNNIKLNDFIEWKFYDKNDWILTNCRWDIDKGRTELSIVENYYAITPGENIPPVVEAGEDKYFEGFGAELTCEAYDPDGFIVSYEWSIVSGEGITIDNPNSQNTSFQIWDGNNVQAFYEFEIKVTDNDGATATDRMIWYKREDLSIELIKIYEDSGDTVDSGADDNFYAPYEEVHYRLEVTPEIPVDTSLLLSGLISAQWAAPNNPLNEASVTIEHDGIVHERVNTADLGGVQLLTDINSPFNIDYIRGSEVVFKLRTAKNEEVYYMGDATAKVEISNAEYSNGAGDVSGVPTERELKMIIEY